jgi:hypothetical protein
VFNATLVRPRGPLSTDEGKLNRLPRQITYHRHISSGTTPLAASIRGMLDRLQYSTTSGLVMPASVRTALPPFINAFFSLAISFINAFLKLWACFASLSATQSAEALILAVQCNKRWMLVTRSGLPYGYCASTCGRCPQVDRQTPAAGAQWQKKASGMVHRPPLMFTNRTQFPLFGMQNRSFGP